MATVFESISLEGIRRADLEALRCILEDHIHSGVYYGNREQYYERLKRLREWVTAAVDYAYSEGVKMPKRGAT